MAASSGTRRLEEADAHLTGLAAELSRHVPLGVPRGHGYGQTDADTHPLDALVARVRAQREQEDGPAALPAGDGEYEIYNINLTYGELCACALEHLCRVILPTALARAPEETASGCFTDLGSGEGFVVALASLLGPCNRSVGIELVPRAHARAVAHLRLLEAAAHASPDAHATMSLPSRVAPRVLCGDMLADSVDGFDWAAESACVFINGTCFDDDVLARLWRRLDRLRVGACVVLTTHELPSRCFTRVWEDRLPTSWGGVTARMYVRNHTPRWVSTVLGRG